MFNDYAKDMSKNIYESKQGTGLRIITPKQMFQTFSLLLPEISAGNNSESLLNEIMQILYFFLYSFFIFLSIKRNYQKSI